MEKIVILDFNLGKVYIRPVPTKMLELDANEIVSKMGKKLGIKETSCYYMVVNDNGDFLDEGKETANKQIDNLILGACKDCKRYNLVSLKNNGFDSKNKDPYYIADFIGNLDYSNEENLAWYNGYIRGLEEAKSLIK